MSDCATSGPAICCPISAASIRSSEGAITGCC
jgi:hypothetical protein